MDGLFVGFGREILKIIPGRVSTEVDAGLSACDPYVSQGAEQFYWAGVARKPGYVLCLAKNK